MLKQDRWVRSWAGLLALGAITTWDGGPSHLCAQEAARDAGAGVDWFPAAPAQGELLQLRVHGPAGRRLVAVEGSFLGEAIHLEPDDRSHFTGLAGVPVDAAEEAEVSLLLRYADGAVEALHTVIPVATTQFRHEELTVAPRYGSPPSDEDRALRAADVAKARAVSEAAHETPRLWDDQVLLPRDDRVTSSFGNGRVFNGQVSSRHLGLDLDGETGDTVFAAARGVVALTDTFQLAGNIVYLNHGAGLVSGYFHLSEQLVSAGDTVVAGTPIGRVGATGRVTGPHLHWVVRYGHVSVDPRSLLDVLPRAFQDP